MKLSERCAIHAEKMNDEGWYVTANILAAAAEILNESDSDMPPEAFTAWRKSRYSSQAAAAKALGLSPRAIFAYEKGETPVPYVVYLATEAIEHGLGVCDERRTVVKRKAK
jgi:DNA-binding XRE family transcriptional regulator